MGKGSGIMPDLFLPFSSREKRRLLLSLSRERDRIDRNTLFESLDIREH